jgi:hypothetical protein
MVKVGYINSAHGSQTTLKNERREYFIYDNYIN